jgi:hypothetical protein
MNNRLDARLQALATRKADVAAAMKAVREEQKERDRKMQERLSRIVGRAALAGAERNPQFALCLKEILDLEIEKGTSDHKFLASQGWLA